MLYKNNKNKWEKTSFVLPLFWKTPLPVVLEPLFLRKNSFFCEIIFLNLYKIPCKSGKHYNLTKKCCL